MNKILNQANYNVITFIYLCFTFDTIAHRTGAVCLFCSRLVLKSVNKSITNLWIVMKYARWMVTLVMIIYRFHNYLPTLRTFSTAAVAMVSKRSKDYQVKLDILPQCYSSVIFKRAVLIRKIDEMLNDILFSSLIKIPRFYWSS